MPRFRLSLHLQPKKFKFKAVKSGAAELNGAALAVIGQNSISERLTDKFPFRRQRAQHLSRDAKPPRSRYRRLLRTAPPSSVERETFLLSAWFYWFDAYLRDNGRLAALTAAAGREGWWWGVEGGGGP